MGEFPFVKVDGNLSLNSKYVNFILQIIGIAIQKLYNCICKILVCYSDDGRRVGLAEQIAKLVGVYVQYANRSLVELSFKAYLRRKM